jgi:hypothetical protein
MLHTVTILLSTFSKHFEYSDINEVGIQVSSKLVESNGVSENSKRFRDWLVID